MTGSEPVPNDEVVNLLEDDPEGGGTGMANARTWKVIIIDDEEEVHKATTFALSGFSVNGRPLCFLHAYSGKEASLMLAQNSDVAVALLDVVMETEDAGLRLVRVIREELGLSAIRIILRTGQPGYAPEFEVIQQYDINDYKTKSELTRTRLATAITSAVRSYEQIQTVEAGRNGLNTIVAASTDLFARSGIESFCDGVLTQICALLRLPPEGLICAEGQFIRDDDLPRQQLVVIGAAGRYRECLSHAVDSIGDQRIVSAIRRTISEGRNLYEDSYTTLFLQGHKQHDVAVFLDTLAPLSELDRRLIEVFASNISIGYENVRLFEKLTEVAYEDQLCHVPNRNKFIGLIEAHLAAGRAGWTAAMLDVDHFSDTNDGLGHERGDLLLKAIVSRLKGILGERVIIARFHGDTFGLFGADSALNPENILSLFDKPFSVDEYNLRISASLGLVRLEDYDGGGVDAIKNAGLALKRARGRGRGQFYYYRREIEQATRERVKLAHDLRRGIELQQLQLFYQPQIHLASGRPIGAEALLRWRTPDGRFVPPDKFIPVAEYSGLIRPIGEWVLRTACRQLKAWSNTEFRDLRLAVNVSMDQFRMDGFIHLVRSVVQENGVNPALIELEITESMAMEEVNVVMATLEQLSEIGIPVAIDDFGTGFSSLGYLQRLRVTRLKIDRAFVSELAMGSGRASIAEMVVKLGHELGLEVTAEGVETEEQAAKLRTMGCDIAQGYLYQRPVELRTLEAWLGTQHPAVVVSAA